MVTEQAEKLAHRLVSRMLSVYAEDYLAYYGEKEPDSIIGLTVALKRELEAAGEPIDRWIPGEVDGS